MQKKIVFRSRLVYFVHQKEELENPEKSREKNKTKIMGNCAYCGKWFLATFIKTYDGKGVCSEECKDNYNKYRG